MTPKVRKLLQERDGLPDDAQVPAPHRAQYPAFKKKFAPVTLVKAILSLGHTPCSTTVTRRIAFMTMIPLAVKDNLEHEADTVVETR
jgi:hypothetical protein